MPDCLEVTDKFMEAPQRLGRIIESVEDQSTRDYLTAVFNLLWEQNLYSYNGRRAAGWFAVVAEQHISCDFVARKVTVSWLRDFCSSCEKAMPRQMTGRISYIIIPFFDVKHLGVPLPSTALFNWAKRNGNAIGDISSNRRGAWLKHLLRGGDNPAFELVALKDASDSRVRRVQFDTDSAFVRQLIMDTIGTCVRQHATTRAARTITTAGYFTQSLGFVPETLNDFTVATMSRQIDYLDKALERNIRSDALGGLVSIYLHIISCLPPDQSQFTFASGLPQRALRRHDFVNRWIDGYRPYIHEPSDPVPDTPLWILFPSDEELVRANLRPNGELVDLSVPDASLQEMLMTWAWRECDGSQAVRRAPRHLKELLKTFVKASGQSKWSVKNGNVVGWVNDLSGHMGGQAVNELRKRAGSLLSYGQSVGLLELGPTVLTYLDGRAKWDDDKERKGLVSEEDVSALASKLQEQSSDNLFSELVYCAFCTIGMTQLRIGDVLALRLSDFSDDDLKGIHTVRVSTKPDGNARRKIQLTAHIHRLLMGLVKSTDEVRRDAPPDIADFLFIHRSPVNSMIGTLTNSSYRGRVRKVCDQLGIPMVTPRDIRRMYQTEVVRRGIEAGYGRLAIGAITGHASIDTTSRYYVRDDIRLYLEATHGLEIGAAEVRGTVITDEELQSEGLDAQIDAVEDGAGYCANEECNIPGTLPCLMCPGFVTTPRCIPEMERGAGTVSRMLSKNLDNQHEREHLLAVKRVYVRYLEEMYRKKMGVAN